MKIANPIRFIMMIVVIGLAIGLFRLVQNHGSLGDFKMPTIGGISSGGTQISLMTTQSKAGWLQDEVDAFNTQNQGRYHIVLIYEESRQSMEDIINGKVQPDIWSPSSPIWIARLSEYTKQHSGSALIDPDDINSCRVFLRTPLVVLTTKERADFVRSIFESSHPWSTMRSIGLGHKQAPWGRLRYSHADPLVSNSGMLTLALILNEYGETYGGSESAEDVANDPSFDSYVESIEHSLVYDDAAKKGSQPLVDAYSSDPTSRDFITCYESAALGAAANNPDLVAIYPNPTIVSEQMVGILNGAWVNSDQKAGAQAFLQMLASQESIQRGITYYMRPASTNTPVTLEPVLSQHASQGFRSSFTSIEMPPYAALNDAAFHWRIHVAHEPVQ
jgi:hypothetical protein